LIHSTQFKTNIVPLYEMKVLLSFLLVIVDFVVISTSADPGKVEIAFYGIIS